MMTQVTRYTDDRTGDSMEKQLQPVEWESVAYMKPRIANMISEIGLNKVGFEYFEDPRRLKRKRKKSDSVM